MKTKLIIVLIFISRIGFSQTREINVNFNSGLFSFKGTTTANNTFINYDSTRNSGGLNDIYGQKNTVCYGASVNMIKIGKRNFIMGIDIGIEDIRSSIGVNGIWIYNGSTAYGRNASGRIFMDRWFFNLFPQIGYRQKITKTISTNFIGGFDIAFCLNAKQKGNVTTTNGDVYQISNNGKISNSEIRPRLQIEFNYKKLGVYGGYSFGLKNYMSGYIPTGDSYGHYVRLGITYRIK